MALKALDIFKLTPKKNCKDCGFPTCMAFSMKVASGAVEVSKCPHMSDDAIAKLSEATAPLMRALKVGSGTSEYELGAETVLFRHEKTLVNRNRYAVAFDDSMTNEQIDFKIANIKAVNYIRIGEEMKAEMIVLEYRDNKEGFLNLVNRVNESGLDVTHIIVCEDVDISKEAIEILKDKKPVVYGANKENYKGMVELVKDIKLALGVKAANLEELYATIEAIQGLGYRELILSSMFTIKYGSIIVIDDIDYSKALPLFALRQNIYTDPQRPMRVEPKVYSMNNADENSPVMVTVDFALTYFIVSGDIERSKVPVYLAIPDAGGYSVLTAWSAGKFSGSSIAKFIKESKIEDMTKNRDLIIPGKAAVLKGDIEDNLPGWNVIIGTEESMEIPKFLKEYKAKQDEAVANA